MTQQESEQCEPQLTLARRQLEAVQRVSDALYSQTDLDALQRMALETAMDVVGADAGSLLVRDREDDSLVFRHVVGPVAALLIGTRIDLSLGVGIAAQVFQSGQARISHDVSHERDHSGAVDARTGYHTRSMMTVPLRRRDGPPFGVVQLINKRTGEFDQSDVAVIEILGGQVALAVQNAVLAQEAKVAAIARSVGEISHDIGNMLTYVLPYVQSLEPFIGDVVDGKPGAGQVLEDFYREVCASVEEGVAQVTVRTREIAGALKGEVAPMEFKLGHPLETVWKVVRALDGPASRAQVTLAARGDETLEVVYDAHRLYTALYNLVDNAWPETPPGGSVTITVAPDDDPAWYTVSVADTGRGMPEEVRAKLFTDAAKSTKPGGTGLGMRIVRRIVEQHGGVPSVASAPGAGTTITLRLPKRPPGASES